MNLPISNDEESRCMEVMWDLMTAFQPLLRNGVYLREANEIEMDRIDDIYRKMDICVEAFESVEEKYRQIRYDFYNKRKSNGTN